MQVKSAVSMAKAAQVVSEWKYREKHHNYDETKQCVNLQTIKINVNTTGQDKINKSEQLKPKINLDQLLPRSQIVVLGPL